MDVRQLSNFVAVADEQQFTRAAIRVSVAQPAVDQRLESLLCVLRADRVIERLPVRLLDPLALALGQLEVARALNWGALARAWPRRQ